jgi:YVTN family beta-propeller protein
MVIAWLLLVVPVVSGSGTGNHTPTSDMPTSAAKAIPSGSGQPQASGISHFVYVLSNGQMQVFDMDNGHQLVKSVSLSGINGGINSILGLAVSVATRKLYISYGGTGGSQGTGSLAEYDLMTDKIVWQRSYSHGTDSLAVTPDGKTLYVPDGESSGDHTLYVVDSATGNELGTITVGTSPHDGMMGLDGKQFFLGPRDENNLYVIDTATNKVIRTVGPLIATNVASGNGVRPYAINGKQTLAYTTESGFLGFQVSDITTGKVLYTVVPTGFTWNLTGPSAPCHGISLSPDEKELYVIDTVNDVVHVYDVTGVPASAPVLVTTIKMSATFFTIGWLQHSLDGRFVYVSDTGDVINTATRTTTNALPIANALNSSRAYIEIDWSNGVPVMGALSRGGQGYVTGPVAAAPAVSLSSQSLTFASQQLNTTSASQSVTLTNAGNATLNISNIGVTGANSGDFAQTNNCGNTVAANNGNCTITVTFTPSATGTRTGSVTITDNAGGNPQSIALGGTGAGAPAPVVTVSSPNLTFASQTLNTTSGSQSVTLTNTGNATLSITNIGVTGANSGDFAQSNNCGNSVAANSGSCTINVTFTPTATGTRTGAVTITDNAAGSPHSINLSGTEAGTSTVNLSSANLTFASQTLNTTSAAQSVTLTNTGSGALTITSLNVTGANSGDFAQSNNCGNSVAGNNGSCTISVTFRPTATGTRTAAVTITDNAAGSPHSFSLSGTGSSAPAPAVSLSSSSLTFASQALNTSSGSQSVTLTNTGTAALSITNIGVTGANSGDYAQTNTCGSSVAANTGTCTISVTFKPTATGTRTASVTITDNAAGSPHSFSLSGTGSGSSGPSTVVLAPTSVNFASAAVGATGTTVDVNITNAGSASLNIVKVAVSGDFTLNDFCGNASLSPGYGCDVWVTFTPKASGLRTGSLTFTTNAPDSPHVVPLTGTGGSGGSPSPAPAVSLSSSSLTFASQTLNTTSGSQSVTLTNTGNAALGITSIGVSGANSGDYAQTNNCGNSVAANNGSCAISVTFRPTATGSRLASVTITDNAPGSPQSISLNGTGAGAPAPAVNLSSSSLTFASQTLNTTSGSQSVTLTNTGNAALSITSIGVTGANSGDYAQTNNCGSSVAANNGNCTISVTFTPTATGSRLASVTITDNAPGTPQSISLSGTGAGASAPAVNLSSSSLTFASQTLNTTSGSQSVTLTNTGNASLSITNIGVTGANTGDFAQTNNCGNSVAANNGGCTISVTFRPSATGSRAAAVTITDNASGSPQSIGLNGTGTNSSGASTVVLTPSSVNFGSATVGSTGTTVDVNIKNIGAAALTINNISVAGDFTLTNFCGNSSLSQGYDCDVWVTFAPKASGVRNGTLVFSTSAPDSPHVVTLTGTGN